MLQHTHPHALVHPREVVSVMAAQIKNLRLVIRHHYMHRHTSSSKQAVRNWIAELRRIDRGSGFSKCVRVLGDTKFPAYRQTH